MWCVRAVCVTAERARVQAGAGRTANGSRAPRATGILASLPVAVTRCRKVCDVASRRRRGRRLFALSSAMVRRVASPRLSLWAWPFQPELPAAPLLPRLPCLQPRHRTTRCATAGNIWRHICRGLHARYSPRCCPHLGDDSPRFVSAPSRLRRRRSQWAISICCTRRASSSRAGTSSSGWCSRRTLSSWM